MTKKSRKHCIVVSDRGKMNSPWIPSSPEWTFEWRGSQDRFLRPFPDVIIVELEGLDIPRFTRSWEILPATKSIPMLWVGNPEEAATPPSGSMCYCFSAVTSATFVEDQLNHFVALAENQKAWSHLHIQKQRKIRQWLRQFKDLLAQKESRLQGAVNAFLKTDFEPIITQMNEQIAYLHESGSEIPRRFRDLLYTMQHCGHRLSDLLVLIRDIQKGVIEEYGFGEEYVNLNKTYLGDGTTPQKYDTSQKLS